MMFTIYEIIVTLTVLHHVFCLKEFDPKCRYTVHLPEASWHTAYDVCQERNKTLANIAVLADLYMVDLVLKEVDKFTMFEDDIFSSGIWFNEFVRVSNQGNTVETCKSLDCALPVRTTSMNLEDGMLCLYYNRTDLNIYPEDCNKSKAFLCESKNKGSPLESCMETSKTSSLKDLCYDGLYLSPTNAQQCESLCIKMWPCYTMTWITNTCTVYVYSDDPRCSFGGNPPTSMRHKSIFLFNSEDYVLSTSKPLAEWCTEPRTLPRNDPNCHGDLSVDHEDSWKTYGAKCRYSVRMPEASWHTAYDVCEQSNQILAEITSLSEMYVMEDLLNDVDNLFLDPFNVSVGLWIGGFMRASDKEILTRNCKSLKFLSSIHIPAEDFTEEILCLYYNRTAMKIYTDSCKKTKHFICERKEIGPTSCMETSETSSLKNMVPQKLCLDVVYSSLTSAQQCESSCIQHRPSCYTMIWTSDCKVYRYKDDPFCSMGRFPPSSLRHKSFFKFSSSDFPVSDPKPLAEWCPEPKKVMILPEKNCNVPTRTTPADFKISQGWEFIDIFNDLNGDMKSKMAVVLDDNEGTCFPLPTQEDFTPFLMMRMPTEPVFGIQTKAFTISISGIGISCNRHSNSRMLQVSYRAIKEPTQFCTLTDNKAVPDAFSRCVFCCDCPDPAHCRDVNLYLASGNAKGAWSLCEVKATNS